MGLFRFAFLLTLAAIALIPYRQAEAQAQVSVEARTVPAVAAAKIVPETWRKVQAGEVLELLVLFGDAAIDAELERHLSQRALKAEDAAATALRAERYRALKARALSALPDKDVELRRDYRTFPWPFFTSAMPERCCGCWRAGR